MKKLCSLLLLAISLTGYAQYKQARFEHLTVENGLPINETETIMQDKLGYIWIGTDYGLVRYDGYNTRIYKLGSQNNSKYYVVLSILESSQGVLWVATVESLFRYDRLNDKFTKCQQEFKYHNTPGTTNIGALLEDSRHNLWEYCWDSKNNVTFYNKYEPATGKLITYSIKDKGPGYINATYLASVCKTKNGDLWLGTTNGIFKYDPVSSRFKGGYFASADTMKRGGGDYVYEAPSEPGVLWLTFYGKNKKGLLRFDTRTKQYKNYTHDPHDTQSLGNDSVYAKLEDKKLRLWIGTQEGISLFDRKTGQFKNFSPKDDNTILNQDQITDIKERPDGKFWLKSGRGILFFDPETGAFSRYAANVKNSDALNNNQILKLISDNTGILWVATGNGVDRLNDMRSQFMRYRFNQAQKSGYPGGNTRGVVQSSNGMVWIGTDDRQLVKWDPATDKFNPIALSKVSKKGIAAYIADREGLIWCSTDKFKPFTYDPRTGAVDTFKNKKLWPAALAKSSISRIFQDHLGTIWLGTYDAGLYSLDKTTGKVTSYPYDPWQVYNFAKEKKINGPYISAIFEDKEGTIWVGTLCGGLNRFDRKTGNFESNYNVDKRLKWALDMHEDKAGRFWIATIFDGLFLFDPKTGKSKQFTEKDGLLCDILQGIQEDKSGNLWISSERGLSLLDPITLAFTNYTTANSLPASVLNFNYKISDGRFIYGCRDGFISFYPGRLKKNTYPPLVHIEALNYSDPQGYKGKETSLITFGGQKIELPHNQNRITFNYVALHYQNAALNQYAYQLAGYDKNWVQAGTSRSVTYTNLSPGTYTFKVKASNSDGVWNNKGDSIILIIHSPWWFTWWAWLLYAIVATGAIWGFVEYRSRQLLRDKRILEETVQIRTSEVMEQKEEILQQKEVLEAQACEAQIEVALERVRSRMMAMYKSTEMKEVIQLIFEQLQQLNFSIDTANFNVDFRETPDFNGWLASPVRAYPTKVHAPYFDHRFFNSIIEAKENGIDFLAVNLSYEEKNSLMDHFYANTPAIPEERKKYVYSGKGFSVSVILMKTVALSIANYAAVPYSDTENAILKRFANVFEQAYTRFLDLQQAEIRAKEAIKQASVDRIRAEIASMRSTSDLERITPLVWKELTNLGVPFIRCGVFIVDKGNEQIHTYLSTPDGKALAAYPLPFNTEGIGQDILKHWLNKQVFTDHWNEAQFKEWSKNLVMRGVVESQEQYLTLHPPTSLDLHFLPFLQGMLYVGNTTPLSDEEMGQVQSLADAFSTAYARYEDFNKLETAKKQVENTLTELKGAQTQLIQSEKMASLGELTAGIAHEIQNPLNFVNNFSDVSIELLDEMQSELAVGDTNEATALAVNIKGNLEKISLHGRRADAIVKNMLQHSRSNSGEKRPADISALADEYMRLAYHGLRAKDKSFNALMHTDFDSTIGKVNIVQQDIGRVLINLYNNAFYAITEKKRQAGNGFEPTLTLKTREVGNMAVISVKDNGNGIPKKVLDKIYQPFFTTKPTGQGTGLGLSLSYDIVKAHGGELKVETVEGEFTEFTVSLPIS